MKLMMHVSLFAASMVERPSESRQLVKGTGFTEAFHAHNSKAFKMKETWVCSVFTPPSLPLHRKKNSFMQTKRELPLRFMYSLSIGELESVNMEEEKSESVWVRRGLRLQSVA